MSCYHKKPKNYPPISWSPEKLVKSSETSSKIIYLYKENRNKTNKMKLMIKHNIELNGDELGGGVGLVWQLLINGWKWKGKYLH